MAMDAVGEITDYKAGWCSCKQGGRGSPPEHLGSEQRPEGEEGVRPVDLWAKGGTSAGPVVGACPARWVEPGSRWLERRIQGRG